MHKFAALEFLYGLFYSASTEDRIKSIALLQNNELASIWKEAVVG